MAWFFLVPGAWQRSRQRSERPTSYRCADCGRTFERRDSGHPPVCLDCLERRRGTPPPGSAPPRA